MPATSTGAMNSWGIYLVTAAALVLVLSPALSSAARDAREGVDLRNAEGVRAVLDSVGPGVSVRFSFGWSGGDPLSLAGHEISTAYGGGVLSLATAKMLPAKVLSPGVEYQASMTDGKIEVAEVG